MDGIVYGITAALGFAAVENMFGVLQGGWVVALLRAFTALPMHAIEGAILGHAVAQARFGTARGGTIWRGWTCAVALHGSYDFAVLSIAGLSVEPLPPGRTGDEGAILGLTVLLLALIVGAAVWILRKVRQLRLQQQVDRHARSTIEAEDRRT